MNLPIYAIEVSEHKILYEFVSKGVHGNIEKVVQFEELDIKNWYNLGFGDKLKNNQFNDLSISNNGDSQKVLATVAQAVLLFTSEFPDAIIYASGSTPARTRLYRIGISSNIAFIEENFYIFGQLSETKKITSTV